MPIKSIECAALRRLSIVSATLPAWLAAMDADDRRHYFKLHPRSKYNPSAPPVHGLDQRTDRAMDHFHDRINKATGGRLAKTQNSIDKLSSLLDEYETKFDKISNSRMGHFVMWASPFLLLV